MKANTISRKRRQILMAGVALPATSALGMQCGVITSRAEHASGALHGPVQPGDKLVVSGRVVGPDCRPVAHANVEVIDGRRRGARVHSVTDADGRFVVETKAARDARELVWRVHAPSRASRAVRLDLASAGRAPLANNLTELQRDDRGTWRTTVALTLA